MDSRQVTAEIRRHDGLYVPVDGETVAATRFAPTEEGAHPVVLVYTPYRKDDGPATGGPFAENLVPAGYEVVVADVVGSGASTSVQAEPFTAAEGEQAATLVEWLADRDWSTGRVGMAGGSYLGLTALRAATEAPDPLDAIVPVNPTFSIYERRGVLSNSHFSGGAFAYQGRWAAGIQARRALPPARRDDEGRWVDVWEERLDGLREHPPWLFQYLAHESPRDDYWADKTLGPERVADIEAATFLVGGWRDSFVHPVTHHFEHVDAPKRLLLGPWRHTIPHQGRERPIAFWPQVVEWFDRYLKDEASGATDWPTVTYWTEEAAGDPSVGRWRGREQWPAVGGDADADEALSFALSPGGVVPADAFNGGRLDATWEADHTVGVESTDRYGPVLDTSADDARSLVLETDPLEEPVEFTGTGQASLRVVPETEDPLVAVRLVDAGDGGAHLLSYGYLRVRHREGHTDPRPVTPGEEYRVTLPLKPKSHVVAPGHRLRVAVSGGFFPLMLPTRTGGFALRSAPEEPSTVAFPGRRGTPDDVLDREIPTHDPDGDGGGGTFEVVRHHDRDAVTFREEGGGRAAFAHGEAIEGRGRQEATVAADDPATATFHNRVERTLDYGHEQVELVSTNRVTRDVAHLDVEVCVDGETVFEESWTEFDPFG